MQIRIDGERVCSPAPNKFQEPHPLQFKVGLDFRSRFVVIGDANPVVTTVRNVFDINFIIRIVAGLLQHATTTWISGQ
ncbi:hypothetical protein ACFL2H_10930, partial [Planctomycetota bacterium]